MKKPTFAIAEVLPGKLNSLVKTLMSQMKIRDPNEAVRRINSHEWIASSFERDKLLLALVESLMIQMNISDPNEMIRRIIRKEYEISPVNEIKERITWSISMDYDMNIGDSVHEHSVFIGKDVNSENFPTKFKGKESITIELVPFSKSVSFKVAIKELDHMGMRPAEAGELLELGKKCSDVQGENVVVALGSVWHCVNSMDFNVCFKRMGREGFISADIADSDYIQYISKEIWYAAAVCKKLLS